MNETAVKNIIASGKTCYFVSPHYDDAVLSAGALASHLKAAGKNRIVVINIFTKAGPRPYTLSAKAFLKQCGYDDAQQLYKDRTIEDDVALHSFADEIINLGFTDALWRPKTGHRAKLLANILPEFGVVYPTYRFHIAKGNIARADKRTLAAIKKRLTDIVHPPDSLVFCPAGIGNHVDHVITRRACDELFKNPIHWGDYPYTLKEEGIAEKTIGLTSFGFDQNKSAKRQLIKLYRSQYDALFPDDLDITPEIFYYR